MAHFITKSKQKSVGNDSVKPGYTQNDMDYFLIVNDCR